MNFQINLSFVYYKYSRFNITNLMTLAIGSYLILFLTLIEASRDVRKFFKL